MNGKQFLGLLLSMALIGPSPSMAVLPESGPRSALGSVTTRGTVRIGQTTISSLGALFSGDQVQTQLAGAVIQYRQGSRIRLAPDSSAQFTDSHVQLQQGQMEFRIASGSGPTFAASTLRLESATKQTIAQVSLQDKTASVSVTEGTLNILDPSGVQLAAIPAGQGSVFQEVSAAALPPDAVKTSFVPVDAFVTWVLLGAAAGALIYFSQGDDEKEPQVEGPSDPTPVSP